MYPHRFLFLSHVTSALSFTGKVAPVRRFSSLAMALVFAAVSGLDSVCAQSSTVAAPTEADLAESHCAEISKGSSPNVAFLYAMHTHIPRLEVAIEQQQWAVQTARIQLDAVEQSNFASTGYGGTRAVIEGQIARAASGAPNGLSLQQATRNYFDARAQLMYLTQRRSRWALAVKQELQRIMAGDLSSSIPALYSTDLFAICRNQLE
jgi:hypothetical protein